MSRRRGAFSAFEKTANQAEDTGEVPSGGPKLASRSGIRRTARTLSADEAKSLLESLRVASSQADFQKALTNLRSRGWGALKKREAVARLLAMAWKASLQAAGFGIDQWGFPEMLAAVRTHHADPSIRRLSEEVERHLRFQPGDLFGSKAGALKQTSSAAEAAAVSEVDVQVTVTHPTDRDSVVVTVPGSASMKHVKEALATKLQRPEITRNGRMVVESPNGDLLPVPDGQRLGGKRQVFMVGISLSTPGSFANAVPGSARAPAAPEPKATRDRPLNLGEAKELLKAFREIASSKEFQRTLGNIHKQGPDSVQKMGPMFIGQSFNRTLAMYDFPLSNEGYQDMARGISKHSWNVHVKAQAHEVERLLRMPPGAFFGIPGEPGQEPEYPPLEQEPDPKPSKPQAREAQPKVLSSRRVKGIEVVAKHAVDNVEVRVELPQNATFYDCKQAISKLLGRDEILRKGRLVQKKGGVYSAFKDEDLLGDTRQVLVLGADLNTETNEANDPMPPIHPYAMGKTPATVEREEGPPAVEPYSVKRREVLAPPKRVKEVNETFIEPKVVPKQVEKKEPKATPKVKEPKVLPPAEEYEICIKHAVEPGEVVLKVWSNWTFGTMRDALARKLKREEISKKARFVFKAGTGTAPWVAFKDQEIVGWTPDGSRRNEVMLLGVDLVEPSEGLSMELTQRLLEEFEKACMQEETQAALEKLLDRGGVALQLGLSQLMGQASQKAADVVGVRGTWKLQRLMDAVKAHGSDRKVVELANSVEKTLRLENGKLFGLRQVSATASAIKGLLGRSQVQDDALVDEAEADAGPPDLTVQQAVAMQRELHAGFADSGFQQRLDNLETFHRKDPKLILLRQELFLSVQSKVLPKYGFRGDLKGVFDMLEAFKKPEFQQNYDFMRLGSELNALLRLTPDGRPRPPVKEVFPAPAKQSSVVKPPQEMTSKTGPASRNEVVRDIEVIVRHAVEEDHPADEEARFTVKSNATMKAVKEALIKHLGKPELLHVCRLVQRVGENGAFSGFKDSEKLNGRRALLVLGVPSLRTAGEEEEVKAQMEPPVEPKAAVYQVAAKPARREVPQLTVPQALALQRDLLQGFSDAEFQSKRKELVRLYKHSDPKRFGAQRQQLFLSVQKIILPKYGFEAGPKGVFDMLEQFDRSEMVTNMTFQQQGAALNQLLFDDSLPEQRGLGPPQNAETAVAASPRPVTAKTPAKEVVRDVEVVIRHAVEEDHPADEEARFTVKSNATMKMVKEALIKHLGKPELLQLCRLVQRVGENGAFSGFKDSEKLHGRRALLVLGIPSLRTAGDEALEVSSKLPDPEPSPEAEVARLAPQSVTRSTSERVVEIHEPPKLTIQQVLALQHDLLQGFSDPEFQSKRKELVRLYKHSDPKRFSVERQKLFLSVQKLVLPKYGFEGGPKGVFEMMQQFDQADFLMNPMFQQQGAVLNQLLFAEDLSEANQSSEVPKPARSETSKTHASRNEVVRDFEVVVRHAVEEDHPRDEEARFTVKSNATMKTVKEALIKHLGKPELLHSCRLVQRAGENGAFLGFKDSEKLNGRRALLVLGLNSLRTAGDEALDVKVAEIKQSSQEARREAFPAPAAAAKSTPAVPAPPKLTLPQTLALQHDLMQGFSDPDFQSKRKELVRLYKHSDPKRFSVERQKLFLSVQKLVLPKYGFEGGPKGVFEMMQQFEQADFLMNPMFQQQGAVLNQLLFAEDLPEATHSSEVPKPARSETSKTHASRNEVVRDFEVLVRHAVEEDHPADEEARFTVKSNATMKTVKEALIKHLGKPELLTACRLVQRVGENGAFVSFKDSEKLNGRRALLVLGLPSLRTAGEEAAMLEKDQSEPSPVQAATETTPTPFPRRSGVLSVEKTQSEPPKLTVATALALQRDLLQGFSDEDFQSKRQELVRVYKHSDPKRFSAERQKLFLSVQKMVLPKYGFDGGPKGVFEMLQQFDQKELVMNTTIQEQGDALNQLLFSEDLQAEAQAQKSLKMKQDVVETEILLSIRHAIEEDAKDMIQLKVTSSWTIKEIKEALAEQLADPQILQTCRFVRRVGESGAFSSLTDAERLGKRRSLLVLGVPTLRPPDLPRGAKQRKTAAFRSSVKLTPAQAVALQQDLYDGFKAPTFRARLEKLWQQKLKMDVRKFRAERQRLFLSVQSVVLPKYGLEGNPRGVFEMLSQFDQPELHGNEEFQEMGQRLNELLFKGEPEAGTKDSAETEAPKEVQVRVRRAGDENKEEVHVIVLSTASMKEVRAAVAEKCKNPSFVQKGRLVRNQGGVLVAYQDGELLRGRRRLLFVGPPLWPNGAPKVPPPVGEESEDGDNQSGTLSLQSARRFLEKVKDACSRDEFQQQLLDATARARQKSDAALLRMGIGALFISSCRHLLRKFGFPDTRQGYDQMFGAIFPHGQDPEVFRLTRQIEELLGVPAGSWFGIDTEEDVLQETPELSHEEGKRLVAEVRRLVAAPNFQREILMPGLDEAQRAQKVYMPLYQLLRPTLLSFGFRGDPQCIQRLQQTVARVKDPKLHSILQEVETQLLRVVPGALLGLAPVKAPETVRLRIRHAVSHVEVRVNVSTEATMSDILEALAKTVGSEDIQKNGRLVESRRGGAFTSFKATEKLEKRRRLLFLGADLPSKDATSKAKNLTRDEAIQLQLELLDAFRSEDFQVRLEELKASLKDGASYYVERRKLVLSVQTQVIPKFGFASDLGGVLEMVRLLGSFNDEDGTMSQRGLEIERLIGERESIEISKKEEVDRAYLDTDASDEVVDVQESGMEEPTDGSVPDDLDFMTALDKLDDEMPDEDDDKDRTEKDEGNVREIAQEDEKTRDAEEERLEERPISQATEVQEASMEEEGRATEERETERESTSTEAREAEARQAEEARLEEERRAKKAREAEEARQAEEARLEEERRDKEAREAEEARQAEEARLEEERRATEPREAEEDVEENFEEEETSPSEDGGESSEAEEEEEDEVDEDWDEAARIVDEISAQIQEVLVATRSASKKEKAALLARKRDLESSPSYVDALAYLEDPEGEQRRRQEAEQEATRVVEEVAKQIAEVLSAMRTASKKEKPVLLAKKRELEKQPAYVEALQYLEDPVAERQRKRQATSSD